MPRTNAPAHAFAFVILIVALLLAFVPLTLLALVIRAVLA